MVKPRIALVDDDPQFLELLERAMRTEHPQIKLTTYSSGMHFLEALPQLAQTERPHLLLLDLDMPHLDGLALTQHIRQIPEYRAVPIIILSGADPNEAVYQTYVRGGNAFIAKPFTYKELKILVYHLGKYWLEMGQLPHRLKAP